MIIGVRILTIIESVRQRNRKFKQVEAKQKAEYRYQNANLEQNVNISEEISENACICELWSAFSVKKTPLRLNLKVRKDLPLDQYFVHETACCAFI